MTRDEFGWLVVRAVGAFFLLYVTLDLILIVLTSVQAVVLHSEIMSGSVDSDDVVDHAFRYGQLIRRIWGLGFEVILKALLSYYCFFRGAWLHRLLTSRMPSAAQS